jgi:hypothetical protein
MFAGSERFQQQDVKDIVDLLFAMEGEPKNERCNDLLDLEGVMILVVHLSREAEHLDIAAAEYNQVADLVFGYLLSIHVYIAAHSLMCRLESLSGLVVHSVHPILIDLAGRVEKITRQRGLWQLGGIRNWRKTVTSQFQLWSSCYRQTQPLVVERSNCFAPY